MMLLFEVDFKEFKERQRAVRLQDKDRPLRYYLGMEGYDIYFVDIDGIMMHSFINKSSFADRVDQQNFEFEFLKNAVRLLKPLIERTEVSTVEPLVDDDLLEPLN